MKSDFSTVHKKSNPFVWTGNICGGCLSTPESFPTESIRLRPLVPDIDRFSAKSEKSFLVEISTRSLHQSIETIFMSKFCVQKKILTSRLHGEILMVLRKLSFFHHFLSVARRGGVDAGWTTLCKFSQPIMTSICHN